MKSVQEQLETERLLKADRVSMNRAHPTANHSMHSNTDPFRPTLNVHPDMASFQSVSASASMKVNPGTGKNPGPGTNWPGPALGTVTNPRRGGGFFSRLFKQKHVY